MNLSKPPQANKALLVVGCLCLITLAAEFIWHPHQPIDELSFNFFYGAFGFVAFILVVLIGGLLRYLLARSQDYYDVRDLPSVEEDKS